MLKATGVQAARLGAALLQLVDRSLRQTNVLSEFGLAPTKYCPRQTCLRCEDLSFQPNDPPEPMGVSTEMNCH